MPSSEDKFLLAWTLRRLAEVFFIAATLASLLAYLSPFGQSFELMSHFRAQYLVVQCFSLIVLLKLKPKRLLIWGLLLLLLNIVPILPYYLTPKDQLASNDVFKFKLLQLNVLKKNEQYEPVRELIKKEAPDLITLQEIDQKWIDELKPVIAAYPFKQQVPQDNNFGIGLYSKLPLKGIRLEHYGKPYRDMVFPFILAQVFLQDKPAFTIMSAHPLPPLGGFHTRNSQFADIASRRSAFDKNLIIAGDLNISPWSSYFSDLVKQTGLRDSQLGFGVQPSWPTTAFLMQTPIDHVLVSENFMVLDRRLGPDVGSDHLPVIVELGLREDG